MACVKDKIIKGKRGSAYIYAFYTEEIIFWKIGITQGPLRDRIRFLQTGCPLKIKAHGEMHTINPYQVENAIHKRLDSFRVEGEWFKDSPQVREMVDAIKHADIRYMRCLVDFDATAKARDKRLRIAANEKYLRSLENNSISEMGYF